MDCYFKEVIGIESIIANGLILKKSLSNTYLNDAENIRNYIIKSGLFLISNKML